jgi:3-hydroxyisobutyrate dehydrogenase-like beta-hydroxyacid dehydrogenase
VSPSEDARQRSPLGEASTATGAPFPVAIIGTGNMGAAMALRLLSQGWPVHVFDLVTERATALAAAGAHVHGSAAAAAVAAQSTIVCVVDAEQARDVLFGRGRVAAAVPLGHTVLLCPTISPADVQGIADALRPQGVFCIDAPMSGGPARARDGSMSLMLAGEAMVLERHRALIETLSSRVFHISERIGDGARTKLVNNLAAGINLVAAAEVLALAGRMGLDLGRTLDVIEQSSGQSWIGSDRMRRAIAGDDVPRAHMALLAKDTRLAVQAGHDAGVETPLGSLARDVFAAACAQGLAEFDDAALLQWRTQDQ